MPNRQVITLTTDFGLADHFVGVMKGVILSIHSDVELVDISHEIGSYDITEGALTLAQSYRYFPPGTIHLVVVDPGVGSARRPILAATPRYHFVAPDNGVLSAIYEREDALEVRHITADHYWLKPVSDTFHGRDIFAPVAAWLSKGVEPSNFGELITDYIRIALPKPTRRQESGNWRVEGTVLRIDKFGNLITNLTLEDVPELSAATPPPFRVVINGREVTTLRRSFAEGQPSEVFAILGSSGCIEIGTNRGSAAQTLQAGRGAPVTAIFP
ncbi:MAG TPA: SAM-dependent chlorinase/fluorinase [Terriglobia bacterium]|nr:SAM-dependent chlorinase/fluorinase [Terriglobia bacterium]